MTRNEDKNDPYNLARFVREQDRVYSLALSEITAGRKHSHWMWYVFPQFLGLGRSETSVAFAIKSSAEAEAYLAHPLLGPRLIECCEALLSLDGLSAQDIFGSPDDLKLRSSLSLFAAESPSGSVFHRTLEKYFMGRPDARTLDLLRAARER